MVVSNYLAFEKEYSLLPLLQWFENLSIIGRFRSTAALNYLPWNLLTSVRLYEDSISQNVRECVPDFLARKFRKNLFSKEYGETKRIAS